MDIGGGPGGREVYRRWKKMGEGVRRNINFCNYLQHCAIICNSESTLRGERDRKPGGEGVNLLIDSCWVLCGGLAPIILLAASCWVPCDGLASHPGGVVILLAEHSCYRKGVSFRPYGPSGARCDFTSPQDVSYRFMLKFVENKIRGHKSIINITINLQNTYIHL